jgi:hypothetical protein
VTFSELTCSKPNHSTHLLTTNHQPSSHQPSTHTHLTPLPPRFSLRAADVRCAPALPSQDLPPPAVGACGWFGVVAQSRTQCCPVSRPRPPRLQAENKTIRFHNLWEWGVGWLGGRAVIGRWGGTPRRLAFCVCCGLRVAGCRFGGVFLLRACDDLRLLCFDACSPTLPELLELLKPGAGVGVCPCPEVPPLLPVGE